MPNFNLQYFNQRLSNTLIGTILLILTYLFFSVMELTAKELALRFNPFLIVFARYLSQLILLLIKSINNLKHTLKVIINHYKF